MFAQSVTPYITLSLMFDGKARILIFSSSYLPVVGGVQTVAHSLAKQLILNGHEVRVATNRYPVSLPASETIAAPS